MYLGGWCRPDSVIAVGAGQSAGSAGGWSCCPSFQQLTAIVADKLPVCGETRGDAAPRVSALGAAQVIGTAQEALSGDGLGRSKQHARMGGYAQQTMRQFHLLRSRLGRFGQVCFAAVQRRRTQHFNHCCLTDGYDEFLGGILVQHGEHSGSVCVGPLCPGRNRSPARPAPPRSVLPRWRAWLRVPATPLASPDGPPPARSPPAFRAQCHDRD